MPLLQNFRRDSNALISIYPSLSLSLFDMMCIEGRLGGGSTIAAVEQAWPLLLRLG